MKSTSTPALLLFLLLASCSSPKPVKPGEVIRIDVLKAFENQKNIMASEFVRDVEFIPLESTKESWFRYSETYQVGRKFVMVGDMERARMLLFDRQGKFLRAIGSKGEGPGEMIEPREAVMDPAEEFIFVHDVSKGKLLKYSVNGQFINETGVRELTPARYITGIHFINAREFVLANFRPFFPADGFASLPVFDRDLKHVKDILPRANDDKLVINVEPHAVVTEHPHRLTFWEPYSDTLYTITPEGSVVPTHVIGFSKGGPDQQFVKTNINPNLYAENSILSVIDDGGYFHIYGEKLQGRFMALYNQKTGETFEVVQKSNCDSTGNTGKYGFENDLYGAGRIWLRQYSKATGCYITLIDLDTFSNYYDLSCIAEKKVRYPELRDRFVAWAGDPEAKQSKLIVLLKAR
jgi:hypothetical protein